MKHFHLICQSRQSLSNEGHFQLSVLFWLCPLYFSRPDFPKGPPFWNFQFQSLYTSVNLTLPSQSDHTLHACKQPWRAVACSSAFHDGRSSQLGSPHTRVNNSKKGDTHIVDARNSSLPFNSNQDFPL